MYVTPANADIWQHQRTIKNSLLKIVSYQAEIYLNDGFG